MLLESTFYEEYFLFVYLLVGTTSKAAAIPRFVEKKNINFFVFFSSPIFDRKKTQIFRILEIDKRS